jgi:hypothetical protein
MQSRLQLHRSLGFGALLLSTAVLPIKAGGLVKGDDDQVASKWCHQYADDAVRAAKINQKYGCYPQNDPYWGTDRNAHYDHCAWHEDDFTYLAYERQARTIQGENCGYCNSDEFRTASANRVLDNKRFACNLAAEKPDYYSDDPHIRYDACLHGGYPGGITLHVIGNDRLSLPPAKSSDVESELQADVSGPQCKGRVDPEIISVCNNYATQAYQLAAYYPKDIMNGCSAGQPASRWSKDWSFHFNWCINPNSAPFRNEEQNVRMTTIRQCAAKKGFAQPSSTDPAFGPASQFGGGFNKPKGLLVNGSSNGPMLNDRLNVAPGTGGSAAPRTVPPLVQPQANPPTSTYGVTGGSAGTGGIPTGRPSRMGTGTDRTPTIPVGSTDGGFDKSKNVPSLLQSTPNSTGVYRLPTIPMVSNGLDTSKNMPQAGPNGGTLPGTYRIPTYPAHPATGWPDTSKNPQPVGQPSGTKTGSYRIPEIPVTSKGVDTSKTPGPPATPPTTTHPTMIPAVPTVDRRVDPRGAPTKSPIVSANTNLPMRPGNDVAGSFMRQGGSNANRVR